MRLFIAEKPSMAMEIAKCLGESIKENGYFKIKDTENYVTWLFGHILSMYEPEDYDVSFKKWDFRTLPIIPNKWENKIDEKCLPQFKIVENLIKEANEIIHAGDPDREGQLLVDEVLDYVGNKKPVKRILLNALDEKSIKKALSSLEDNAKYKNIKSAAEIRQKIDWLTGFNFSRAFTLAAKKKGYDDVYPVGRVKTPTLAIVVRREHEIQNFKPIKYYTIVGLFKTIRDKAEKETTFQMQWKATNDKGLDIDGRLTNVIVMRDILERLNNGDRKGKVIKYEILPKSEKQRKPFSLSTLQITAGQSFGYEPQQVLDICQTLYEKKLTTYPRSDCEYLPENQFGDANTILHNLKLTGNEELAAFANATNLEIKSPAWNDKKISAHHAIIPTEIVCDLSTLKEDECNIYYLIARSYITQFMPEHTFNQTRIEVDCSGELFTVSGKTVTSINDWKILYQKDSVNSNKNEDEKTLPELNENEIIDLMRATQEEKMTTPPKRFTPATLIQAMKEIHKFVKDEELKKKLKEVTGIGTEATRATIIDELLTKKFITKDKKAVVPTEKGKQLIKILPDELTYPDFTAIMEEKLETIILGEDAKNVLEEQVKEIEAICNIARVGTSIDLAKNAIQCPICGKGILSKREGKYGLFWTCTNYPECKTTYKDNNGKPKIEEEKKEIYSCPICEKGKLFYNRKFDFWGCSEYKNGCKASFDNISDKPAIHKCPNCTHGFLKRLKGKHGQFWKCKKCEKTFSDNQGNPEV